MLAPRAGEDPRTVAVEDVFGAYESVRLAFADHSLTSWQGVVDGVRRSPAMTAITSVRPLPFVDHRPPFDRSTVLVVEQQLRLEIRPADQELAVVDNGRLARRRWLSYRPLTESPS